MLGRYAFAIVVGTIVTLTLLFVMHLLIAYGEAALTKPRERHQLEFVRVKRNENVQTEDVQPENPPPPPQVPPDTPPQQNDDVNPDAISVNVSAPQPTSDLDIGGPGSMNVAEGDYLPIVRVAPVYPARALSRGIEGYVDMGFTVTTTGSSSRSIRRPRHEPPRACRSAGRDHARAATPVRAELVTLARHWQQSHRAGAVFRDGMLPFCQTCRPPGPFYEGRSVRPTPA